MNTEQMKPTSEAKPPVTIVYHRADFDGIASGLIIKDMVLRMGLSNNINMIGSDYGDQPIMVPYDHTLYLVDLSKPELMDHPNLVWIDHHKTAIEMYPGRFGFQLDGVSACRLCWSWSLLMQKGDVFKGPYPVRGDFEMRRVDEPLFITLLGEYDVWDKRDPGAELLQYGLRTREDSSAQIELMIGEHWSAHETWEPRLYNLIADGRIAHAYAQNCNAGYATKAHDLSWQGLTFLCLNHSMGNSLTFESAIKPYHDACLMWRYDGMRVTVSLYGVPHRPDLDLSPIAKALGGGGHRQACGFTVPLDVWTQMLLSPSKP